LPNNFPVTLLGLKNSEKKIEKPAGLEEAVVYKSGRSVEKKNTFSLLLQRFSPTHAPNIVSFSNPI